MEEEQVATHGRSATSVEGMVITPMTAQQPMITRWERESNGAEMKMECIRIATPVEATREE